MFTKAIVKTPCPEMVNGISSAKLGKPDYAKALEQHSAYINALESCGLKVTVLEADSAYPDSCFVEDAALVTPNCAIITRPGALSRRGETTAIEQALASFYEDIAYINPPGTLDAGDMMMVGKHFSIGLSERTNRAGAKQMIAILEAHGLSGSTITMNEMLHLKTGVSYLEHNNLVVTGEMVSKAEFKEFNKIIIDEAEAYAANCIWVNDYVLLPQGRPKAKAAIEAAGYKVISLNTSEFEKLDGGLSCLSLRF
jgi:dimethylargininase